MDWSELVLHPVRLRVLQHLRAAGEATAKEIAAAMGDVPRATAYRHVKALEEGGAIDVARTRRVRGATEKTYALSPQVVNPSPQDARALSAALHLESMGAMDAYLAGGNADLAADRVFFQPARFWATDEEYDALLSRIKEAVGEVLGNDGAEGRRLRTLAIVSAPPDGNAAGGKGGDGR